MSGGFSVCHNSGAGYPNGKSFKINKIIILIYKILKKVSVNSKTTFELILCNRDINSALGPSPPYGGYKKGSKMV